MSIDKKTFEEILNKCCDFLTKESQKKKYTDSSKFENAVRRALAQFGAGKFTVSFTTPKQGFPDIPIGEFGVEVKLTKDDTWRSIANSVEEKQRDNQVQIIYIVFGKMGGVPSVRWAPYEDSVIHVRTSHVPRFEVDLSKRKQSLFKLMGVSYDDFYKLPMEEKMKYIRDYARKIHPNEHLWWIEDNHTLPLEPILFTSLPAEKRKQLRAEAALLCPQIVNSHRDRHKYDDVVTYLLTYHGVLCHQARDLFSAGSVANPKNDNKGGIYIERALLLLQEEMIKAAKKLPDYLFIEYWKESVPPDQRIKRWLQKVDALAKDWRPSRSLFLNLK